VALEPCDNTYSQQFVLDIIDSTIRLSSDPVSCFDGANQGEGIPDSRGVHMYTCFDDPTGSAKSKANGMTV
jgi:hypothetical protein